MLKILARPVLSRLVEYFSSMAKGRERHLACPILEGGPFVFNIPIIDTFQGP
jgi:hypothetical protein